MNILFENDILILTTDFKIFDKTERIFLSLDYGVSIKINKKRISFRKTVKEILKTLDKNPCEYIDNSDLKDAWKTEFKDTWNFYHTDHYPLKDYFEYTTFDDPTQLENFYIDKFGIYSLGQDKYLTTRRKVIRDSSNKTVIDIIYKGKFKTVRYDEIMEKIRSN